MQLFRQEKFVKIYKLQHKNTYHAHFVRTSNYNFYELQEKSTKHNG